MMPEEKKFIFFPENLNVSLGCPSLQMICYIAGNFEAGNSLNLAVTELVHTYIHTYFIGSSPRGFSESILHYKIINQVHDNKNITMIKEDKGQ